MRAADALVVGAGIAGLAAAERLAAAGRRVVVVEARDRTGGRIHTVERPGPDPPVELGAEFVHGHSAELLELIRAADLTLEDVPERHQPGPGLAGWAHPDPRALLARLLRRPGEALLDRPVAELLRELPGELGRSGELEAVAGYLQGFHAADLALLGTRALAENEAAEDAEGDEPHRLREGYGALVRWLVDRLDPGLVEFRLRTVVRAVRWREGEARLEVRAPDGATSDIVAPRAILTLPLPMLRRPPDDPGAVPIDPAPAGWPAALAALHMGAAERIVLRFDERWWVSGPEAGPGFVHGTSEPFPVWWTSLPSLAPVLTGWTGGPRAAALAGQGKEAVLQAALESLASVFARDAVELRSLVCSADWHDWTADPFSGGAYSYGGVGAIEARAALARPVAGTLFLAGEAVAERGRNGTVHGALASGREAAARLLGQE
ncbi:MAG TPA: NAD(P)/FAD-dependent oxidoreductase [Gemmatimonadales bacterium]|nr:NAD(P)/FAD-dependent oxidoreductase [Gemmatimonadales bacterium]